MERLDSVVVGAGVIGLGVARELAKTGREVVVVEAENVVGAGVSARNSEVVHAGIYYAKGSLKARLCVEGRELLYDYCARRDVPFRRTTKLIVATSPAELDQLDAIRARAAANGVADLTLLDAPAARKLEPELACHGALFSPSSGIVDGHGFMRKLLGDAEDAGTLLALGSRVIRAEVVPEGLRLEVDAAGSRSTLIARNVVNAAGLFAPMLASRIDGLDPAFVPAAYFAKGSYFALRGPSPFSRLVYPVPVPGGLGVHITLDLAGRGRFGPDVEWLGGGPENIDYTVDPHRADRFYEAIRRYWPRLPDGALDPDYSGVRPKLVPEGVPEGDFVIQGPADHGVPGLVNLFGIESPGLTAALAIARESRKLLDGN